MNSPSIIVYEQQSHWAPLLRRELGDRADCLREVRSSRQARELLGQSPGSLLIIELSAATLDAQLDLLLWMAQGASAPCTVSVGPAQYAKLAAEAGAVAHFSGLHQADLLARLVRRHLSQPHARPTPETDTDIRTTWRARLKWDIPAESPRPT